MDIYERFPHSCLLYLASILVNEYSEMPEIQDDLVSMLKVKNIFKKNLFIFINLGAL